METPLDVKGTPPKAHALESCVAQILCAHRRIIDDVRTRRGKPTGKVRCLECGAIFDDPPRP
ncbi:MAG: hypothetical protein NNA31_08300 [Nitrospira sp.]|jgi:hypothetical protein|uniref:Uncharacterized protein n=1 Tax=Candidatus Nitrospira inopinata TaxID=1715989 RepID=A0A0S4KNN7_9BACT|nr:hypothetical protein [Candidatus Nitrospira inopinata]MCP9469981.1 hypothetical protein [Nitrospira sp.]CUQ66067.1 protein of unknown function [Candidatus Nitrospira inopinata]